MEITSPEKQKEVDAFLNKQSELTDKDDLWMALRKYECWVWTSDTPMCHTNWMDETSNKSGGQIFVRFLGDYNI